MGLSRCSRCPIWCADATHTQNLAKSDPATTPAPWTVQWHLKALKSARGLRRNRISPRSFPRDTCDNLRPNRPWRSPRVKNQAIELANSSHWRGRCSHVDSVEKSAYAKHLRTNKEPPLPRSDPHLCPKSPKYSLSLLEMQVSQRDDTRILLSVAFLFGELMTALDIQVVCEKIAKWLGGELYGSVNLDFSGTNPSLEMMVELVA